MSEDPRVGGDELSARVGELRRLTIMFCDVVGSTELSGRLEPETYRELMRGSRAACRNSKVTPAAAAPGESWPPAASAPGADSARTGVSAASTRPATSSGAP